MDPSTTMTIVGVAGGIGAAYLIYLYCKKNNTGPGSNTRSTAPYVRLMATRDASVGDSIAGLAVRHQNFIPYMPHDADRSLRYLRNNSNRVDAMKRRVYRF